MNTSTNKKYIQQNRSHQTNHGQNKSNVKPQSNGKLKNQQEQNLGVVKANSNLGSQAKNPQKPKATYSAQYESPKINQQQNRNTNNPPPMNNPNLGNYSCCNGIPLYNVSQRAMYNGQNVPMGQAGFNNNMQEPCPCGKLPTPPPMPPCENDLWDLQFCRWWGWNWIRKREEMLNQKKTELKAKRATTPESDRFSSKPRKHRKRHDFFSWCNKWFKGRRKTEGLLKDGEKQQLQDLYDTPCSSVTFNKCPCPMDNWDCRSLNLKGEYECYCGTKETSRSTVIISKTRRQRCKQNVRKHQSWVCEKTDSSSSEEFCPHVNVCPQRNQSSTEESIEYLSMRMAHIKSDCEDNEDCCCCMKPKPAKENICCSCKPQKKPEMNVCCPCTIKLVYKKPKECRKRICYPIIEQKVLSPCRSLPACRSPQPRRVPQFRKFPLVDICPDYRKRSKRKYVNCDCHNRTGYIVACLDEQPKKKKKTCCRPKEVDCYYCCCCCCCNKQEGAKTLKSKSENNLKQTADKCISSKSMVENLNVVNYSMYNQLNDNNFCGRFPIGDGIQSKVHTSGQFNVSKAVQEGLYKSPVTGRLYNLNPETYAVNEILPQSKLPEPLGIDDKTLYINPIESEIADEEHQALLTAVCEAILSSRYSKKEHYRQTEAFLKKDRSPNDNFVRSTIFKRSLSYNGDLNRENFGYVGSDSEQTQKSEPITEMEKLSCKTFSELSKPFDYKILLSPNNEKVPLANIEMSELLKCNAKTLFKSTSGSTDTKHGRYLIKNGKHGPVKNRHPARDVQYQNYKIQQMYNLNVIDDQPRKLQMAANILKKNKSKESSINSTLGELSATNIYTFGNEETTLNSCLQNHYECNSSSFPTILKSSTDLSSGDSGDHFTFDDSLKDNLPKNESELFIPFNSPRTWRKPRKLTGISRTGLFSTVNNMEKYSKNKKYIDNNYNNTNDQVTNSQQLKKQRLYNALFSNNNPQYSNIPYKFNPIPNETSVARNPTIYPSLILRELPPDAAEATQTSSTNNNTTTGAAKKRTCNDLECNVRKGSCKRRTEDENNLGKSQAGCSRATETYPLLSKAIQTSNSRATNTHYINYPKSPKVTIPKEIDDHSKLTQTLPIKTATASNTVYSAAIDRNPQSIFSDNFQHVNKQTKSTKVNKTNFISTAPIKTEDVASLNLHIPANLKSVDMNTTVCSNSPRENIRPKRTTVGQRNESETSLLNLNSKSTELACIKLDNQGLYEQDPQSIVFTNEHNSEKEMGCRYFENINSKHPRVASDNNLEYFEKVIGNNSGSICVYLEHEPQDFEVLANADVNLKQSEQLLTVVNRSESYNLPLPALTDTASTAELIDSVSSKTEQEIPKHFKSAIPTPVYINTATSPFKIRYTKTRLEDRPKPDSFVKQKVLKRESPFSMFCTRVQSNSDGIDAGTRMAETGSLSRPDRQMVVSKPKKLKVREKRWRY